MEWDLVKAVSSGKVEILFYLMILIIEEINGKVVRAVG